MFKLGLTGSIGMGKSTTAQLFLELGCDLWDADAAVHRLYSKCGAGVKALEPIIPSVIVNGAVSRDLLRNLISKDPALLKVIEQVIHPLVRQDRENFARDSKAQILIFDIPLLFETGSEQEFDAIACVYIDAETQKQRVLDRGAMTQEQFNLIKSKQMPIEDKVKRADFVIKTDSLEHAKLQVSQIVQTLKERISNA
jgi:dephospho-CoA kinase